MKKLILTALLMSTLSMALNLNGKVISITDGDTFTLLTAERKTHKIRLRHIDTPEKKQPFGEKSKQALSDLIFLKQAIAECHGKSWARHVCDVTVDGADIQAEMIRLGMAWVFPKYNRRDDLPPLQEVAIAEKVGVWSLPKSEQIPPWKWRKKNN